MTVFLGSDVMAESVDVDWIVIRFVITVVTGDGCTVTSVVWVVVFKEVCRASSKAVEDFTAGVEVSSALGGDSGLLVP